MTSEEQLIRWLREKPGRTLMSDSDLTIKAKFSSGFERAAMTNDDLCEALGLPVGKKNPRGSVVGNFE